MIFILKCVSIFLSIIIGFSIGAIDDGMPLLVPTPQTITYQPGVHLLLGALLICCPRKFAVSRLESAVGQWIQNERLGGRIERDQDCDNAEFQESELSSKKVTIVTFTLSATVSVNGSGYFLDVNAYGINIISRNEEGLFYALMTLKQIVQQSARLVLRSIKFDVVSR